VAGGVIVSIHAPRAGRDAGKPGRKRSRAKFQSTRPARGATPATGSGNRIRCFNPRAPRGARPLQFGVILTVPQFQSTRPARGATPRACARKRSSRSFNPRAPRGARHLLFLFLPLYIRFQSTRPARGATRAVTRGSPRTGSFNPRAPRGARRNQPGPGRQQRVVSIHAPRAGRDSSSRRETYARQRFNPRAPRGARRKTRWASHGTRCFNPRAPRGARPIREGSPAWRPMFQSTRPARGATGWPNA